MPDQGKRKIFVFGSNLAGIHGAGSARAAMDHHGAEFGVGAGPTGNAYAIPTKDKRLNVLPLATIRIHVYAFLWHALQSPGCEFAVVKIGCGLAGYAEEEIAPMFQSAPENCILPDGWR